MNIRINNNTWTVLAMVLMLAVASAMPMTAQTKMTKQERTSIRKGNKLYNEKRFAEAEVEYRKALQANPSSEKAQFNLATALMRQGNATASQDDEKNPMNQAVGMLTNLAQHAHDKQLRGKASYDLGNIAYSRQQYDQAVEFHKHALRCNPNDDHARDNLRLAQLKKQQQDQNKDKNKDNQDQDKNKDNKDQNKDQNKDNKDQDKDKEQNKDQQQDKNQDQQQDQQQQDKKQQQQQGGMSQQNAEQVLKAMQDRERATQQRINAQQAQQQRHERQRTNKKW